MDIQLEMEDWKWMWISKLKPTKWAWDICTRKRTMKALGTHPSFPSQHKLDKWRAKLLSLSFSKPKPTGQPFSITLVTLVLSLSQPVSIQYKEPTVFLLLSSLYCLPEKDQPHCLSNSKQTPAGHFCFFFLFPPFFLTNPYLSFLPSFYRTNGWEPSCDCQQLLKLRERGAGRSCCVWRIVNVAVGVSSRAWVTWLYGDLKSTWRAGLSSRQLRGFRR